MIRLSPLFMAAAALGALIAAPGASIAAPITYDFSGTVSGDQALTGTHLYTAAGGPNLTAISGSYSQSGTGSPVAGDAFAAAFCSSYMHGASPVEAAEAAVALAAHAVARIGARPAPRAGA